MSRYDIAVLTLRAFALYAWFQALEFFAGGAMSMLLTTSLHLDSLNNHQFSGVQIVSIFGPSVIFILVGVFLFVFSRQLASRLLPASGDDDAVQLPPHPLPIASVAFAVVGVAIFLCAVPHCLSYGIRLVNNPDPATRANQFRADSPMIIANAVQLILGFLLFLNSRTFATAWWRKFKAP